MARGGFHGGGFHSGGHHSGGGFRGGGSHFSGGGHYSGGSHYSGVRYGGGSSGGGDDGVLLITYLLVGAVVLILYFLSAIAEGAVPGLNLVNLGMFVLSGFLFYFSLRDFERTADLKKLKRIKAPNPYVTGRVWNGSTLAYKKSDKRSWVGKYNYEYQISFYDPDFGTENAIKVKETMTRTPKILWMNLRVWLFFGIVFGLSTFFFYETVIPYFENMIMTDMAFEFIDDLVFYLPAILTLLCSIATMIISKVRDRILYKCAERIVNDNTSAKERSKTESYITSQLSKKWYYNFCPNCGAVASHALRSCSSCGSSLEVKSFDTGEPGAVHRITSGVGKENKE